MASKSVVRRGAADRNAREAVDHYVAEASAAVARGFIDALEAAYRHIGRYPASGSPRHALLLRIAGLRTWPLQTCPYVVFYFEHDDRVEIWRVLHGQRDLGELIEEGLRSGEGREPTQKVAAGLRKRALSRIRR